MEYARKITEYDDELLDKYETARKKVEDEETFESAQLDSLTTSKDQVEFDKDALNKLIKEENAALGLAVSGFFLRREVVDSRLDYDNGEHLMRFWTAVWCSLLFSLTCAFLPAGGWPFLAVFVVLSLFSNLSVGIVFSGVFLMIATLWGQSVGIFFLYFISGVFAACLFQHLEQEFAIGIPLFLSLFCLLLCETANVVLLANEHLSLEQFLVPAANLIVSGILLLGILKIFSGTVVIKTVMV
jgi:hypothetical protein